MLNDTLSIGCVSEFEAEDLCVLFRLLKAVTGILICSLRRHDSYRKIWTVPEEIICAFLRSSDRTVSCNNNTTIGEGLLLADAVVVPSCSVEFRQDILSAGISFG